MGATGDCREIVQRGLSGGGQQWGSQRGVVYITILTQVTPPCATFEVEHI